MIAANNIAFAELDIESPPESSYLRLTPDQYARLRRV
jgi:hypothetical protein